MPQNTNEPEHHLENDGSYNQLIEWWGWGKRPNYYFHKLDGPAVIITNGQHCTKQYWQNNTLHRIDGPAITWYDIDDEMWKGYYYMCNKRITQTEFNTPGFIDSFIINNS